MRPVAECGEKPGPCMFADYSESKKAPPMVAVNTAEGWETGKVCQSAFAKRYSAVPRQRDEAARVRWEKSKVNWLAIG